MKIYAVKDRLLNYYLTPWVAPNDNEVKAGLSTQVSNPEEKHAIAQAPHHFELWQLAEIDEEGTITPKKEFICDLNTLVRTRRQPAEQGKTETGSTTGSGQNHAGSEREAPRAETGHIPDQARPTAGTAP